VLAVLIAAGAFALAACVLSSRRVPVGRERNAWRVWAAGMAAATAATILELTGSGGAAPVVSDSLLAAYALLAAGGLVCRLPAEALSWRRFGLEAAPLVLAVTATNTAIFGRAIDDSASHVVTRLISPAAFTILAAICVHCLGYIHRRGSNIPAALGVAGMFTTALTGVTLAFAAEGPADLLADIGSSVGFLAIGLGGLVRARAPDTAPDYAGSARLGGGWSWGSMAAVGWSVGLVLLVHGREDDLRLAAAVAAFACFAARFVIARRDVERLVGDVRAAEQQHRFLLENVPLAIYIDALDEVSTNQYVSPAIEPLLGYTREELAARPDWFPALLHPDDRDEVIAAMLEWYETDKPWACEYRLIAKDAGIRWVRDEAVIIRDEGGHGIHAYGFLQDITERREAVEALRESEARKAAILNASFDCIVTADHTGRIVEWNAAAERTFGYRRDEVLGREVAEVIVPPAVREAHRLGLRRVAETGSSSLLGRPLELTAVRADGDEFPVELVLARVEVDGAPMFTSSIRDITARKQAEHDLRAAEKRYRDTLENVNLLALALDTDGTITYCNDHVCEVTGWRREELIGHGWYELVGPEHRRGSFLREVAESDLDDASEEKLRTRAGQERVIVWWNSVSRDESGEIIGVNSIGQDITERRLVEERLTYLRHYDELTGLPNRTMFSEWLGLAVQKAADHNRAVAVVFVNIENFRVVNDAYGHAAGDDVLQQFAQRLGDAAQGVELLARHGADEFLILIADTDTDAGSTHTHDNHADVLQMAEVLTARVRHALARPFMHDGNEVYLNARTGISVYPVDAASCEDLLKSAHIATYERGAVRRGERRGSRGLAPREELEMIARIHGAIEREEFLLHYQPVVELATGAITSVEALIRWQPPRAGMVPPGMFIPLAERTGLIAPITDWVVGEACRQTVDWRRRGIDLGIAFNFPVGLWDPVTVRNMLAAIRGHGLEPNDLMIEVTESAVATTDASASRAVLDLVREEGVRLAIDDFGTGYSSLSRLAQMPATVLKIDRSFVRDLPGDADAAALTTTIIQLAHNIGVQPLAEGIETEDQRRYLHTLGCQLGQGFLFSKPVPAADIESMLLRRDERAA
jgi:diguanylate cyclase (GGDEF)-like protein/PAS domain S-box-containing protein